ncbi:MAG: addiction module protein [Planctomycetes bacterium]|nr:addiction module protein [Planctomycetota bacterium]
MAPDQVTVDGKSLDQLSAEEQLELIGLIWKMLSKNVAQNPAPQWQIDLARERAAALDKNPRGAQDMRAALNTRGKPV